MLQLNLSWVGWNYLHRESPHDRSFMDIGRCLFSDPITTLCSFCKAERAISLELWWVSEAALWVFEYKAQLWHLESLKSKGSIHSCHTLSAYRHTMLPTSVMIGTSFRHPSSMLAKSHGSWSSFHCSLFKVMVFEFKGRERTPNYFPYEGKENINSCMAFSKGILPSILKDSDFIPVSVRGIS